MSQHRGPTWIEAVLVVALVALVALAAWSLLAGASSNEPDVRTWRGIGPDGKPLTVTFQVGACLVAEDGSLLCQQTF